MGRTYMTQFYHILSFFRGVLRKKMQERQDRQDSEGSITINEMLLLISLVKRPQVSTSKELSAHLGMSPALISRNVESLIQKGLVTSQQDPNDRRIFHLTLHPAYQMPIKQEITMIEDQCWDVITQGISQQELDVFEAVLDKIVANIQEVQQ